MPDVGSSRKEVRAERRGPGDLEPTLVAVVERGRRTVGQEDRPAISISSSTPTPGRCERWSCATRSATATFSRTESEANTRRFWKVLPRPAWAPGVGLPWISTSPGTCPMSGRPRRGQQVDERRLAGAVGPDQAMDPSGFDPDRHIVDRDEPTELHAEPVGARTTPSTARRQAGARRPPARVAAGRATIASPAGRGRTRRACRSAA